MKHLCASQFQPRAFLLRENPGHLKQLVKCLALRETFVGKCPALCFYYDGQMPSPPVRSDQYAKVLVAIF